MKEKIGIIAYSNSSGLGQVVKNFRKNLGIDSQFVIPHQLKGTDTDSIECDHFVASNPPTEEEFKDYLNTYKPTTVIVLETPFNWEFLPIMKGEHIKVVYIPLMDCVPFNEIKYKECVDRWIVFNQQAFIEAQYHRLGSKAVQLNYPIDTDYFTFQKRSNHLFLHNAGYYVLVEDNWDAHKGTDHVINAFIKTKESLLLNTITPTDLIPKDIPNIIVQTEEKKESRDLYRTGSIYVAPSRWEGLGLPLLESMSCGMVLLTTNGPPMYEAIRERSAEFLINAKGIPIPHGLKTAYQVDMNDFIYKIMKLANLPQSEIEEISHRNREYIENYYSWHTLKERYYESLTWPSNG